MALACARFGVAPCRPWMMGEDCLGPMPERGIWYESCADLPVSGVRMLARGSDGAGGRAGALEPRTLPTAGALCGFMRWISERFGA